MILKPYLLFLGDAPDQLAAKVAQGIADWRPEHVVGQLRLDGCKADAGVPDLSLSDAWERGARTLVVGVANRGGIIPEAAGRPREPGTSDTHRTTPWDHPAFMRRSPHAVSVLRRARYPGRRLAACARRRPGAPSP